MHYGYRILSLWAGSVPHKLDKRRESRVLQGSYCQRLAQVVIGRVHELVTLLQKAIERGSSRQIGLSMERRRRARTNLGEPRHLPIVLNIVNLAPWNQPFQEHEEVALHNQDNCEDRASECAQVHRPTMYRLSAKAGSS